MTDARAIIEATGLPAPGWDDLRLKAASEGFAFLDRLQCEYDSGDNRFDRPGEALLGALAQGRLVGIGGLIRDPFAGDPEVGRLRHLYVTPTWRRRAVGAALVARLLDSARGTYRRVRLRTDNEAASTFYLACGFVAQQEQDATHHILLG